MELNATLITVQGALMRVCKSTGGLSKIKYKGGNEMKIAAVVNELKVILQKENCLVKSEVNSGKAKLVEEIVFLLALNCEYQEEFEVADSEHLMGMNFKLSKCLFANVITELNLISSFGNILEKLPLRVQTELLEELAICLKKATAASSFLVFVIDILSAVVKQVNIIDIGDNKKLKEDLENLIEISAKILDVLRDVQVKQMETGKSSKIYQEMGYAFLRLLQLLLLCEHTKQPLAPLIKDMVHICCEIAAGVTVDVFCEWAEVEEQEEPLQMAITSTAYYFVQKYQDHDVAKTLLQFLGAIARKPKSIYEQIQEADTSKIIEMIEKGDENQKQWFRALFRTRVFSDEKAIACVEKHCNLCSEREVERVFTFCAGKEVDERKLNLVLKCASTVPLQQLIILVTRYFKNYGVHTPLNRMYNKEHLVILLNKMGESNDEFLKELLLLLIQNLKEVLTDLYRECLRDDVYSGRLKNAFSAFKEIITTSNTSFTCLQALINDEILLENYQQLTALLKVLLVTTCIKYDTAITNLIIPLLKKFTEVEINNRCTLNLIKILNEIDIPYTLINPKVLFDQIFVILYKCRTDFSKFDAGKYDVLRECIKFISACELCDVEHSEHFYEYTINQFYIKKICCGLEESLFNFLFPNYQTDDYYQFVCQLTNVLPGCVTEEWKEITLALQSRSGIQQAVKTLNDVLILLSHVLKNQNQNPTIVAAFKHCLNNYMISVKELHQTELEDQVAVAKSVTRLLRTLPPETVEEDGLVIASLISVEALKTLSSDREFVCGVIAIENKKVCKSLACKMTG